VQHPQIQKAIVLAREDRTGDKRLVAYLISSDHSEPGPEVLRSFVQEQLPSYMAPSDFVIFEKPTLNRCKCHWPRQARLFWLLVHILVYQIDKSRNGWVFEKLARGE